VEYVKYACPKNGESFTISLTVSLFDPIVPFDLDSQKIHYFVLSERVSVGYPGESLCIL
jgi:hypothetical protein